MSSDIAESSFLFVLFCKFDLKVFQIFLFCFFLKEVKMRWWCDAIRSLVHHCRSSLKGGAKRVAAATAAVTGRTCKASTLSLSHLSWRSSRSGGSDSFSRFRFSWLMHFFRMAGRWSRSSTNRSVAFSSLADDHFTPVDHHQRSSVFSTIHRLLCFYY